MRYFECWPGLFNLHVIVIRLIIKNKSPNSKSNKRIKDEIKIDIIIYIKSLGFVSCSFSPFLDKDDMLYAPIAVGI